MQIGWYIARLRNMNAPEIAHRVTEKVKKTRARKRLEGWSRYSGPVSIPRLNGLAEAVATADAEMRAEIATASAQVQAGQFAALGQTWPHFSTPEGKDTIWHLDPVTGQFWPDAVYCFDVGYRGAREIGDVKYVWEFGRLQFLQPVAAHAFLADDGDAVAFVEQTILSWHASNPPFRGVGWSSGIELALRAISILVVTSLIGERFAPATQRVVADILRAHAFWLERYPSRFSSANNHLVSEDAALFLLAMACDFLPRRAAISSHAAKGLEREAALQILADGVPAEQSPTYGALTAELLLLCAFVGRQHGSPLGQAVDQRLGAYAEYVHWLADSTGQVVAVGDDDEGRVVTLVRHETRYPASVAAAIAAHLDRPEIAPAHERDLRNVLLPCPSVAPPPKGAHSFADGGYTVYRGPLGKREMMLVIDHGPLGYLSIAAHGHADALAVEVSLDNQPLFIDAGTYLYHSGHEWRDCFWGTRAHNTLTMGGVDQSIIAGAFNWSHKASATLEAMTANPFSITASHDGYQGRFGMVHRRHVAVDGAELLLVDTLVGSEGAAEAELAFQLAPDVVAVQQDGVVSLSIAGQLMARLHMPPGGTISLKRGAPEFDGGWYSPSFGVKLPATRLSWFGTVPKSGAITRLEVV